MILVTGGSGYVGSHTVKRLASQDRPVRVLVHNRARAEQAERPDNELN